jgi:hypothetical protein
MCTYAHAHAHVPWYPMHACTRKHAHTDQYVILTTFPQQQRFRERASVLRYTYIACLVELSLVTIIFSNYKVKIKHRVFLQYKSLCKMLYSFVIKPDFKDGERRVSDSPTVCLHQGLTSSSVSLQKEFSLRPQCRFIS